MLQPYYTTDLIEAGCDEVGRGCLAGPVVAAAVILPKDYFHPLLNDSKKVTPANRVIVAESIKQAAISWAIGQASNIEIDEMNIFHASCLAIHRAIKQLRCTPQLLLVDGKYFKAYPSIPHQCIVDGDAKWNAIAAASILAKTYRDAYMHNLAKQFPGYGWESNVGYPTNAHQQAIQMKGITPYHRKTYGKNSLVIN